MSASGGGERGEGVPASDRAGAWGGAPHEEVRRRAGVDADARSPRGLRRAIRFRARPRGHHAPIAHEHPDGAVSVSARRPREQRIPARAERAHRGDAVQARRLLDRRIRRGVSGPLALRLEPGLRRVRRSVRRVARADGVRPARAPRDGSRSARAHLDRRGDTRGPAVVRLGPPLRSALALPSAAGSDRSSTTSARSINRRSSSSPATTANRSATTASSRTACSPTSRRCGFR